MDEPDDGFDVFGDIIDGETPGGEDEEEFYIKVIERDTTESRYKVTPSKKVEYLISLYLEDKGFVKDFAIAFTYNGKVLNKEKTFKEQSITNVVELHVEAVKHKEKPFINPQIPEPVNPINENKPKEINQEQQKEIFNDKPKAIFNEQPNYPNIQEQPKEEKKEEDVKPPPKKKIISFESDEEDDENNDNDEEKSFYLTIKGTDGSVMDIYCNPNDLLSTVKDKYFDRNQIKSTGNMIAYFSFEGKTLNLYKKINEIDNLTSGKIIHFSQRMRGGI